MEVIQIKNGFLLVENAQDPEKWVYCPDKAGLHAELEFFLGVAELPSPPIPPTPRLPPNAEPQGVRQFNDED